MLDDVPDSRSQPPQDDPELLRRRRTVPPGLDHLNGIGRDGTHGQIRTMSVASTDVVRMAPAQDRYSLSHLTLDTDLKELLHCA